MSNNQQLHIYLYAKEEYIFKIRKATNKTYAKTDQKQQKTSKL